MVQRKRLEEKVGKIRNFQETKGEIRRSSVLPEMQRKRERNALDDAKDFNNDGRYG